MSAPKWEVGQTVCLVTAGRRERAATVEDVVITKIGRRWVTCERERWNRLRFNAETGAVDSGGYSQTQAVYLSRAEYEMQERASAAWDALREELSNSYWRKPAYLSESDIMRMRAIYKGEG